MRTETVEGTVTSVKFAAYRYGFCVVCILGIYLHPVLLHRSSFSVVLSSVD